MSEMFTVGGVRRARPFIVRRLGHVGLTVTDIDASLHFYRDHLGLRVTDWYPFSERFPAAMLDPAFREARTVFMRFGGDHHSVVLLNRPAHAILESDPSRRYESGITVQQISWQVDTLKEVVEADRWLQASNIETQRAGRDMPGSNWHTYFYDCNGYINELFYGMEQIGWDGYSKPFPMHARLFNQRPPLPQISEYAEVTHFYRQGVSPTSGTRDDEPEEPFEVDGILLARPFKVTQIGPLGLFVPDVKATVDFYRQRLGLAVTEIVSWQGFESAFLRCGNDHHALALFPLDLREHLGLPAHTTLAFLGLRVTNYGQLQAARSYLQGLGYRTVSWPHPLVRGFDYVCDVMDPDGHVVRLYHQIEQLGWSGQPRGQGALGTAADRWPEVLDGRDEEVWGAPFYGPLG